MPLSFNPEDLPVLGLDSHLPPVAPASIAPAAIRLRFDAPPPWEPEIKVERRYIERAATPASVLIGIVLRDEPTVLLTQRTDHLTDHPSQISFPGGRVEPSDADAVATALREAEEEIGLEPAWVEVLGSLPTYTTSTGFVVTPVVGTVRLGFDLRLDPFEVAEVFEVPLAWLMNPANHQRHAIEVEGVRREFFSIPWPGVDGEGRSRRYFIWGATAAMLRNLYRFLSA
ncbi:MAG: CoA pyrophosphatase [Burkholderiales bacterium]|nr:CoA pyrophosphatase [Burkholderiales bacterium]